MSTSTSSSKGSVAVVGGGITGLVAAFALQARGHTVRLFEASPRLGGSIGSESIDGWLVERGPNSLLDGEPVVPRLISELGLAADLVAANAGARKRFIVRDGRVQALPMSPVSLLTTRLFSWGMRAGIFAELFQKPRVRPDDCSIAEIVADHFGQEAVDYGLNPFVAGVYAGDPGLLSAQHAFPSIWKGEQAKGSIIRGMMAAGKERRARGGKRPGIISFRRGLQTLVDSLASKMKFGVVRLSSRVTALKPEGTRWKLSWQGQEGGGQSEVFDKVFVTVPAQALATISIDGDLVNTSLFRQVVHPPVTSLFLGYKATQVAHPLDGFGVLMPAIERRNVLGVLFSSTLFPERAPTGYHALTVMVGGMRQPEVGHLSVNELMPLVKKDLSELLGVAGEPVFARHTTWPAAIPQYNLGYGRYLEAYTALEERFPGIHFGGNARDGISVPCCIAAGYRLAESIPASA